jgi:uncharacterized protein (TIGR00251 family)
VILSVRVIPRAARSAISGRRGDAIVVRLAAPPVDGAANDALIEYLARTFDRPRRDVRILSGESSRNKRVRIDGIDDDEAAARLSAILKALG